VLLRHANGDSNFDSGDIARILEEAALGKRRIWVSSVIFAEFRPKSFVPGKFRNLDEFVRYIRQIAETVSPTPDAMLMAARLRDVRWERHADKRQATEKPKCMTLGDAIHIASALWVKEALDVQDLEFLTFDDGRSSSDELDPETKSLSILSLEDYTSDMGDNPDVRAVVGLRRLKPILPDPRFIG
jgi:hypothetical protein